VISEDMRKLIAPMERAKMRLRAEVARILLMLSFLMLSQLRKEVKMRKNAA